MPGRRRVGLGPGRHGLDADGVLSHRIARGPRRALDRPGRRGDRMTSKDDILEEEDRDKKDGPATEPEAKGLEAVEPPAPTAQAYEQLKRERDDFKDQVLRRRADFDNYRKRVERDRDQAAIEAKVQVLAGLLPTIDNLEKALEAPIEA